MPILRGLNALLSSIMKLAKLVHTHTHIHVTPSVDIICVIGPATNRAKASW